MSTCFKMAHVSLRWMLCYLNTYWDVWRTANGASGFHILIYFLHNLQIELNLISRLKHYYFSACFIIVTWYTVYGFSERGRKLPINWLERRRSTSHHSVVKKTAARFYKYYRNLQYGNMRIWFINLSTHSLIIILLF